MAKTFSAMTSFAKDEVQAIFNAAKRYVNKQGLEIRLAPKLLPMGRIVVITARASGNAPKRNRIRRRLKSIFYEEKLFDQGYDWIVIARKPAIDLDFSVLKQFMATALKKAVEG